MFPSAHDDLAGLDVPGGCLSRIPGPATARCKRDWHGSKAEKSKAVL